MAVSKIQKCVVDPFLKQAAPVLQTYWNTMHDITDKRLVLRHTPMSQQLVRDITITISVPFVVIKEKQRILPQESKPNHNCVRSNNEALHMIEMVSLYNHQLKTVVEKELNCKKALHTGDSVPRILKKMTELKNSIDPFIKVVDSILAHFVMKHLGFDNVPGCPSMEALQEAKCKVQDIKKHLKKDELHQLFEKYSIETTKEKILGSLLGLKDEFGDWLFHMDTDFRYHQDDIYYVREFIEDREAQLIADGELSTDQLDKDGLVDSLIKIGFVSDHARAIAENILESDIPLQIPSFWAIRYVEHVINHHPLLLNLPRYPYQEITNKWFQQKLSRVEESMSEPSDEEDEKVIPMINMDKGVDGDTLVETFLDEKKSEDCVMFYHGTSHEKAYSILNGGINVNVGHSQQDFSHGNGFYLFEEFDDAKIWCQNGRGEYGAVIAFKVPVSKLNAENENGLDVSDNRQDWEAIVRYNRRGENWGRVKKQLKKVTFVRGPICKNPVPFASGKQAAVGFGEGVKQICIRDEDYAEEFGCLNNICFAVFY